MKPANDVVVSAPGKVHLMGEHSVVYGKPALLTAINRRLSVRVFPSSELEIHSEYTDPRVVDHVRRAVQLVCDEFDVVAPPTFGIDIQSNIPIGFHLGSSAALAVAVVGAVSYALKGVWNPQLINKLAYEVEKGLHGNPSGGDNTISTYGGLLWYRKELEYLKSMWQLPFQIPEKLNRFSLINTGKPEESTKEMIEHVFSKKQTDEDGMNRMFDKNEQSVKRVTDAIKSGNEEMLVKAIQTGQETLEYMGVVSEMVVPFVREVQKSNGAAKVLGGGGKKKGVGYMLCYMHDLKDLDSIAKRFGFAVESVKMGEEGVRLESGKERVEISV